MPKAAFSAFLALGAVLYAPIASPAVAQNEGQSAVQSEARPLVASDVAFFQDIELGNLTLSPVNIFHDTRCEDPEFCFRNNRFAVSFVMFTEDGLEEIILRLFEPAKVPGGTLTLTNSGTPPSRNGAIGLEKYRFELEYRPTAPAMSPTRGETDENDTASERAIVNDLQPARA